MLNSGWDEDGKLRLVSQNLRLVEIIKLPPVATVGKLRLRAENPPPAETIEPAQVTAIGKLGMETENLADVVGGKRLPWTMHAPFRVGEEDIPPS